MRSKAGHEKLKERPPSESLVEQLCPAHVLVVEQVLQKDRQEQHHDAKSMLE